MSTGSKINIEVDLGTEVSPFFQRFLNHTNYLSLKNL